MKKLSLLGLIILFAAYVACAQRVSESQASLVCKNFLTEKGKSPDCQLRITETFTQENGESAFYRFDIPDGGFVIVSASKTTPPILAYSLSNNFELIPPVRDLFELYKAEIEQAEANKWDAREKAAANWNHFLADEFKARDTRGLTGGPLLTTTWDQGRYYNTYCPWDVNAGAYYDYRVPNGCVALACSQLINYHRFPESGIGVTTYVPQGYPRQTVYFYKHKYNYDAMCDHPTNYANEIAKLAYHFGVAIQMNYNYDGSGAQSQQAKAKLQSVFNYDQSITTYYRGNYLDTLVTEFIEMLKNEINNRRVVYYSGCNSSYNSCHAYLLDGYDENDLFSLNYGWGGASNGYYAIDNFVAGPTHFDFGSETIVNIFPSGAVEPTYCQGHKRNTASFGYVADGSPTTKPYQSNPDCSWMVAVPDAYQYNFKFDRIDLNEGDYVTIYNGPTEESGVLVSLTGSELPQNNSFNVSADSVLITFKGNTNNTDHYGFLISYSSTLPARTCSGTTQVENVWTTTISDGSQDGENYMPETNCTWNIRHQYISGYAFTFTKFDLGYGDFVDIYNAGTNPATFYKRFDINNVPEGVYNVPFKRMQVRFVADNWDQKDGFSLGYYALAAIEDYNGLEDLTVYPNPATDNVNIDFTMNESEKVVLSLFDMTGKMLRSMDAQALNGSNHVSFDVSGLANGIYVLEINTEKGKSIRKITVQ